MWYVVLVKVCLMSGNVFLILLQECKNVIFPKEFVPYFIFGIVLLLYKLVSLCPGPVRVGTSEFFP